MSCRQYLCKAALALTGVTLDRDCGERRQNILHLWAQELRRRAQRVPILAQLPDVSRDMFLLLSGHSEVRALEQVGDRLSDLDLAGVRACNGMEERGEGSARAEHRFGAHRRAYLGEQ